MENKTAMQMLRDKLQVVVNELTGVVHGTDQYGYRGAMENVIKDIDAQMMDIEKEQIYNAFVAGSERGTGEIPFNCEQYFDQTYKP
jgi:hypothetical protein